MKEEIVKSESISKAKKTTTNKPTTKVAKSKPVNKTAEGATKPKSAPGKTKKTETEKNAQLEQKSVVAEMTTAEVEKTETAVVETETAVVETEPSQTTQEEKTEEEELRTPCEPYDFRVEGEERQKVLKEIKEDALRLKNDLAATQFNTLSLRQTGKAKRMFALRHGNDIRIYINATISGRAGGAVVEQLEECAPEMKYIVLRPQQIRLVFISEVGEPKETILEGIAAAEAVKQVEREEGILIWDIGKECPRWDKMTEPSRLSFVKAYLEELASRAKEEPSDEEQKEYISRKEAYKAELKAAQRGQHRAEFDFKRKVEEIKKSRIQKRPWEE